MTTEATSVANLKRLLSQFERLDGERARHEDMIPALARQEDALMKVVDLGNPLDFEKVSQVRLRRELVPRKVEEFSAAAASTRHELVEECRALERAHLEKIEPLIERLILKISASVAPFFPPPSKISDTERVVRRSTLDARWDALDGAEVLVQQTETGRILFNQRAAIVSNVGGYRDFPPTRRARTLLEFISLVDAMQI